MLKKLKPYISIGLLLAALGIAALYVSDHRYLITQLRHTPLRVGLTVLALYVIMFVVLMIKFSATLKICNTKIDDQENVKLNAHTLLINFFIPGQGGPVYTSAYLFKKHGLKIKNYLSATVLYYLIYALLSVCLLLAGSRPLYQTIIAVVAVGALGLFLARRYMNRAHLGKDSLSLHPPTISWLTAATLLQAVVQTAIYAVELKSVNHAISLSQIITYTGAANLAMFAALTPGAIGIRESFLLFTEKLNHLSSNNILLASLIDRSIYLVFLGLLIVVSLVLHINIFSGSKNKSFLNLKRFGSVRE